jgi:glycosyltransferase involved in cell wall biosynthesis
LAETSVIKILHIITGLDPGGAEMMLCRTIAAMDRSRFTNEVISLTEGGALVEKIRAAQFPVRSLRITRGIATPFAFMRLVRWIRTSRPDVVHTWMYHANLVGGLAARLAGNIPVVWGIHHNSVDPRLNKWCTLQVARMGARLSRLLPERIVCCSASAQKLHASLGYAADRLEFIPNGFDLDEFRPNSLARISVRGELGVPQDTLLIGMAARYHPLKDLSNFLSAAARIAARFPRVHFVLCGIGLSRENEALRSALEGINLRRHCHLLGIRHDMARLFGSLDIATSSSISEAFPLAVGEAMACGISCVVTDAGDSALLVGNTGRVVPTGDPEALSVAWAELISSASERRHLGSAARHRIETLFNLSSMVRRYEDLYERLVAGGSRQPAVMARVENTQDMRQERKLDPVQKIASTHCGHGVG